MFNKLKTLFSITVISCIVFLLVLAPAEGAENTVWTKLDNSDPPGASDTTNWGKGRIPLGTAGKGDTNSVTNPDVIKDGSTYRMWYTAHDGVNNRIYYATSSDGLTWTKYDNSVPTASNTTSTNFRIALGISDTGDDKHAMAAGVINDGSFYEMWTYKMWYTGYDVENKYCIYYATSEQPQACTIFMGH